MKKLICFLSTLVLTIGATFAIEKKEPVPSVKLTDFKLGELITGPAVDFSNTGGKAVLIEAWGIHCGPCLASLPDVEKLAKHHKDKLIVVGAHSQNGTNDEVMDVVKKNKLTYTITKGVHSPISFSGIPRTFVFDTTGQLVFTGSPFDKDFEKSVTKATHAPAAK